MTETTKQHYVTSKTWSYLFKEEDKFSNFVNSLSVPPSGLLSRFKEELLTHWQLLHQRVGTDSPKQF